MSVPRARSCPCQKSVSAAHAGFQSTPSRIFGCGISDLRIDQGIHNLLALMDYVNNDHKDGKVMLISLRALHLEAGVGYQIMECPEKQLSYLNKT